MAREGRSFAHTNVAFCRRESGFTFRLAKSQQDVEKLIDFMYEHFFTDEPPTLAQGGFGSERPISVTEQFVDIVYDGLSLLVEEEGSETVIGMAVGNKIVRNDLPRESTLEELLAVYPPINAYITHLCDTICHVESIFQEHDQLSAGYSLFMLGTHKDFRGQGLAKGLITHIKEVSVLSQCEALWAVSTHNASRHILNKAGIHEGKAIKWDHYEVKASRRPHTNTVLYERMMNAEKTRVCSNAIFGHDHVKFVRHDKANGLVFRLARDESDQQALIDFLYEHFFVDEPSTASFGGYGSQRPAGLTQQFKGFVQEGLSMLVEEEASGKVVAMNVGCVTNREDSEDEKSIPEMLQLFPPAHTYIMCICDYACNSRFLFETNPDMSKGYYTLMLGVHEQWRGKGLATRVSKYMMEVAKLAGCQGIWAAATNDYSRKLYNRLGMEEVRAVVWQDWTLDNGERPFEGKQVKSEACVGHFKRI